ncbi:MAG: J domain-containing protein [Chitinophagaceae bacterium]
MELKDYYQILELPPSATPEEIKRSYRRMAQVYHPDKSADDPYAAAQFAVVKEAYEVLTDPTRRNLYLQERWLAKSSGKIKPVQALNPVTFLKQMLEKERTLSRLDNHRVDRHGLMDELMLLFSGEVIVMLNQFGDRAINSEIVRLAILSAQRLSYQNQQLFFRHLEKIGLEENQLRYLRQNLRQSIISQRWDRAKIWLLLLAVTAICILIFMVGR